MQVKDCMQHNRENICMNQQVDSCFIMKALLAIGISNCTTYAWFIFSIIVSGWDISHLCRYFFYKKGMCVYCAIYLECKVFKSIFFEVTSALQFCYCKIKTNRWKIYWLLEYRHSVCSVIVQSDYNGRNILLRNVS